MDRRTEAITISPTLFLKSVGIISLGKLSCFFFFKMSSAAIFTQHAKH